MRAWKHAVDSCMMMTRCAYRVKGVFRDQDQNVYIFFLRSCSVAHTGPESPGSGDQVSGPKCWDFRYTPLCQTQRRTSPKLPLPHPPHQYNVHPLKHQQQEALGGSLLFCGWSPWLQTVPARVLLKLLEEELPLEVPQVLQDLRRQRLR